MAFAMNVVTEAFERIDPSPGAAYNSHKAYAPPYQHRTEAHPVLGAPRTLYVHKIDKYVVWLVGGGNHRHYLMLHPRDMPASADRDAHARSVGDYIDKYKLDRAMYAANDPTPVKAATGTLTGKRNASSAQMHESTPAAAEPTGTGPSGVTNDGSGAVAPASAPKDVADAATANSLPEGAAADANMGAQAELALYRLRAEKAEATAAVERRKRVRAQKSVEKYEKAVVDKDDVVTAETIQLEIIQLATDAYAKRIAAAKKKGAEYEARMDAEEAKTKNGTVHGRTQTVYQYKDDQSWVDITDKQAIAAYDLLHLTGTGQSTGSFSMASHTYQITRVRHGSYSQRNNQTLTLRDVQSVERKVAVDTTPRETLYNGMLTKDRHEILFGSESPIELPDATLDRWKRAISTKEPPSDRMSLELSQLAQTFAELSMSNARYVVDHGTQATNPSAKPYGSHTDGKHDFNSVMWIKPDALSQWIANAKGRKFNRARILCHGANGPAIDAMRANSHGLCMEYAGTSGQVYGPGTYYGLSDHATVAYNYDSGYPAGSFVMSIFMTPDPDGWMDQRDRTRHFQALSPGMRPGAWKGAYGNRQISEEDIVLYKTIHLHTFSEMDRYHTIDAAVVLHDSTLATCLGFVHTFDDKKGWRTK
tara:strand:+ start:2583 stop:4526 length:1944 start_codon:yes stop_codon:yes gene_type:complete